MHKRRDIHFSIKVMGIHYGLYGFCKTTEIDKFRQKAYNHFYLLYFVYIHLAKHSKGCDAKL